MKLNNPENLKHHKNSKQREDQMARMTGNTTKKVAQKEPLQRRAIQRITTQRGTDRD